MDQSMKKSRLCARAQFIADIFEQLQLSEITITIKQEI